MGDGYVEKSTLEGGKSGDIEVVDSRLLPLAEKLGKLFPYLKPHKNDPYGDNYLLDSQRLANVFLLLEEIHSLSGSQRGVEAGGSRVLIDFLRFSPILWRSANTSPEKIIDNLKTTPGIAKFAPVVLQIIFHVDDVRLKVAQVMEDLAAESSDAESAKRVKDEFKSKFRVFAEQPWGAERDKMLAKINRALAVLAEAANRKDPWKIERDKNIAQLPECYGDEIEVNQSYRLVMISSGVGDYERKTELKKPNEFLEHALLQPHIGKGMRKYTDYAGNLPIAYFGGAESYHREDLSRQIAAMEAALKEEVARLKALGL